MFTWCPKRDLLEACTRPGGKYNNGITYGAVAVLCYRTSIEKFAGFIPDIG
jgi:hypothetical protein